jgi:CubicO group peptidase (beta-lactamase class C family)
MHTAHFSPNDTYNYGLGWEITNKPLKKTYGHYGAYVGALNSVTVKPDDNTAVILFSNECDSEIQITRTEWKAFSAISDVLFLKSKMIIS